jgi:hypothetical protein
VATGLTTPTLDRRKRVRLKLLATVLVPDRAPRARKRARRQAVIALSTGALVYFVVQVALAGAAPATYLISDPLFGDKEQRLSRLERAAPPGAPRVILIGTSRAGYAFAAGRTQAAAYEVGTPAVAFNLATPATGPITHLIHLRRLLALGHKPDLLVLEVLPPLLAHLPDGPFETRILHGDLLTREEIEIAGRYGVPVEGLERQWRAAALAPIHEHRFKLLGRIFSVGVPYGLRYDWGRTADDNGWNAFIPSEVSAEERTRRVAIDINHYRAVVQHDLTTGPAVAALRDILALARAEKISVVLVVCPESSAFRAMYPAGSRAELARFLAALSAEFGCGLTDASDWLADDEFFDSHHALRAGAERFTDRLTAEVVLPFLCGARPGSHRP